MMCMRGRKCRRRFAGLMLCLALLLSLSAHAELPVTWTEGEEWFPDKQAWTYHYQYRYPALSGEDTVSEAINHYFDLARNEMANLVLPMYAADPIMAGQGGNKVSEQWTVTCNSDELFSALLHRTQTVEGGELHTISSVVFATSGEYAGDTLTLRGVVRVGDSSQQLAELVLNDIWRQIEPQMRQPDSLWLTELSRDSLAEGFFPEEHFYANQHGDAVFYLQPGVFRRDQEIVEYVYAPQQLERLLTQ